MCQLRRLTVVCVTSFSHEYVSHIRTYTTLNDTRYEIQDFNIILAMRLSPILSHSALFFLIRLLDDVINDSIALHFELTIDFTVHNYFKPRTKHENLSLRSKLQE